MVQILKIPTHNAEACRGNLWPTDKQRNQARAKNYRSQLSKFEIQELLGHCKDRGPRRGVELGLFQISI